MSNLRFLCLAGAAICLGACASQVTEEACLVGDKSTYQNVKFEAGHDVSETGKSGPNRAGVEAFNERIIVAGFKNRRKSQFAFYTKTSVPRLKATEDLMCKSEKLLCEDNTATHCQIMRCKGVIPAQVEINIIDTPINLFYRTEEPTYMEWDGQSLKCRPA